MPIGRCCPLWRYPFTLFLEADELCEDHLYQKGELCKDHLYQKEYWEKLIWTTWSPLEYLQVDIYAGLRVSDQQTKHTFNCCTGRRNRQVLTWHDYNTRKPSLSDFPPPVHPVSSKNIDSEGNDDFDVAECDEMTNRGIWWAKEHILFVMMWWQWFPTYSPPANCLPNGEALRATIHKNMHTPISSWIKNYELDNRVRDMIREFLLSTVKKSTKSQQSVTRVMMVRVNQLGDIEEHDDEILCVCICIF